MNLLEYVKNLAPVMERRELLSALDQVQLEYSDTLAPILADVTEAFTGVALKSNFYKQLERSMHGRINFTGPALPLVLKAMENAEQTINAIRKEIRSNFSIQFTNVNLSFSRANVTKMIDVLAFFVKYARKLLITLIARESAVIGKATRETWSPAELDYIAKGVDTFTVILPVMLMTPAVLTSKINGASSATIEDETFSMALQTLDSSKTDPLAIDGFSPRSNIFLGINRYIAELKHSRYLLAKEELFGLEQRLEELRTLKTAGSVNPASQKLIQDYEKRISEYEYEIGTIERKAGVR